MESLKWLQKCRRIQESWMRWSRATDADGVPQTGQDWTKKWSNGDGMMTEKTPWHCTTNLMQSITFSSTFSSTVLPLIPPPHSMWRSSHFAEITSFPIPIDHFAQLLHSTQSGTSQFDHFTPFYHPTIQLLNATHHSTQFDHSTNPHTNTF